LFDKEKGKVDKKVLTNIFLYVILEVSKKTKTGGRKMQTFKTQDELKKFLTPVLNLRVKSLKKEGIKIDNNILFNTLKKEKWQNDSNLHLYEIVNDILHFDIKNKYKNEGDRNETI